MISYKLYKLSDFQFKSKIWKKNCICIAESWSKLSHRGMGGLVCLIEGLLHWKPSYNKLEEKRANNYVLSRYSLWLICKGAHIYLSNFCHLISAAYCCILSYKDKRIFIADGLFHVHLLLCVDSRFCVWASGLRSL